MAFEIENGVLIIPDGVTSIKDYAFMDCSSFKSVKIPDSVTSIGWKAFYNCSSLESINVSENNQNYASVDGVLYNKDMTELIQCPKTKKEFVVPDGVTKIECIAFNMCDIESITISDSVTELDYTDECGEYFPFSKCHNLESIKVSENNPKFADVDGVLYDKEIKILIFCPPKRTNLTIPSTVKTFGWYYGCFCGVNRPFDFDNNLEQITIPVNSGIIDCFIKSYDEDEESDIYDSGYSFQQCLTEMLALKDVFFCCDRLEDVKIRVSVRAALDRCEQLFNDMCEEGEEFLDGSYDSEFGGLSSILDSVVNGRRYIFDYEYAYLHREDDEEYIDNGYLDDADMLFTAYWAVCYLDGGDKKAQAKNLLADMNDKLNEMLKNIIYDENVAFINHIAKTGDFLTKGNIDELIEYARDEEKLEISVILMNYKNEHFGFDDPLADFKL